MMFSDDEIKELPEGSSMRPGDEIISIREVYLVSDKFDKKDSVFHDPLLLNSGRNDLDVPRSLFRDGFFPEGLEAQQARFAWTEEDGNIAALVSEPGFGTTGQTTFGKDLDAALKSDLKGADTSSDVLRPTNRNGLIFSRKPDIESQLVSSTSSGSSGSDGRSQRKNGQRTYMVDKSDPRSRFHYVKYVKRHGRTIKLWECGICGRDFQHQYTLMRHLPIHTDERNFHCNTCGKSFRQLSTLSQHRAIHSAERPYSCEVCNKTFNRVSTLISHRKTHSDDKPYKCHLCPKGFHQKGNLRNHLFTHTNERPYRCHICYKGFNQQSNLVCHKSKTHPEDGSPNDLIHNRSTPNMKKSPADSQPISTRPIPDQCEVSSSVGSFLPIVEPSSSSWPKPMSFEISKPNHAPGVIWNKEQEGSWGAGGVIVDAINTYHMSVALATNQTPFALLMSDVSPPVLVKVVDTQLPDGKQMLVPATAEDLRIGGKIMVKNEVNSSSPQDHHEESGTEIDGAVQIRVPVVATVVPRFNPAGQLQLVVEEPHHAYHTALSSDMMKLEPCSSTSQHQKPLPPMPRVIPRPDTYRATCNGYDEDVSRIGAHISSRCTLPPPAPSPPLDFIHMDLFEPMDCIPLGPQITAVDNIDEPRPSDDSDFCIEKFEDSISLSDTD